MNFLKQIVTMAMVAKLEHKYKKGNLVPTITKVAEGYELRLIAPGGEYVVVPADFFRYPLDVTKEEWRCEIADLVASIFGGDKIMRDNAYAALTEYAQETSIGAMICFNSDGTIDRLTT